MDLETVSQRACLMKSVPGFMKGFYRLAMSVALAEIDEGRNHRALLRTSRGWKLFLALPRLLLHRPPRGGQIPKVQLQRRIDAFSRGDWASLLASEQESSSRQHRDFLVADAALCMMMRRPGLLVLRRWCNWVNYRQPARHLKGHQWRLATQRRLLNCRTLRSAN